MIFTDWRAPAPPGPASPLSPGPGDQLTLIAVSSMTNEVCCSKSSAAGELQRDRLPGVGAQREGVLGVPGVVVEVGVGVQGGQHRAGAVQHLHLQRVVLGGRGGLRRVDVQPETEVVGGAPGRQRDRLRQRVGVWWCPSRRARRPSVPLCGGSWVLLLMTSTACGSRSPPTVPPVPVSKPGLPSSCAAVQARRGRRRARLVALRALADRVHGGDLVEVGLAVGEAGVGAGEARRRGCCSRPWSAASRCRSTCRGTRGSAVIADAAVAGGSRPVQRDLAVAGGSRSARWAHPAALPAMGVAVIGDGRAWPSWPAKRCP